MKKFIRFGLMALALIATVASVSTAAPLTSSVNTPQRGGAGIGYAVASNAVVYGGAIAALDRATGKLVPATDTTNLMVVGRVDITVDNGGISSAAYASDKWANVSRGIFRWDNGDTFTAADVGALCFVKDDHTVQRSATSAHAIPVGVIVEVDSVGVWVDTASLARQLTGSLDSLSVTGAGGFGGALSAAGATTLGSTLVVTGTVSAASSASVGTTLGVGGATTLGSTLVVTGTVTSASTVSGSGFRIGSVVGWSGAVTNISTLSTNVEYWSGGIVTNVTHNP